MSHSMPDAGNGVTYLPRLTPVRVCDGRRAWTVHIPAAALVEVRRDDGGRAWTEHQPLTSLTTGGVR
ncbi:MAG: hypothetical protein ACRDOJ_12270 [Nocardioidaceae bacterium]